MLTLQLQDTRKRKEPVADAAGAAAAQGADLMDVSADGDDNDDDVDEESNAAVENVSPVHRARSKASSKRSKSPPQENAML